MIFFQSTRGKVVRLTDDAASAAVAFVDVSAGNAANAAINFAQRTSIITRVMLAQEANVQFLHAVGDFVYIYAFGDRMGQIGLSGLSFAFGCDDNARPQQNRRHGIAEMSSWYNRFRVSSLGRPVRVAISTMTLEGFVVNSSFDTVDPESGLMQWNLGLRTLPESTE